jgi:hypothetical protein
MERQPPTPHPTSVNAESTFNPLPSHRFLDASRRYPVREVVDFWEGPIPGPGSIEEAEVSATEERVDCWGWEAEEGDEARIIRRAVGPSLISNQTKQSKHGRTFPPSNDYDPSPSRFSGALEIAASPGVPTLASRTERGGPERCVRWSVYIPSRGERDGSRGGKKKKMTLTLGTDRSRSSTSVALEIPQSQLHCCVSGFLEG